MGNPDIGLLGRGFTIVGCVLDEAGYLGQFVFDCRIGLHALKVREPQRLSKERNLELGGWRGLWNLRRDRSRLAVLRKRVLPAEEGYAQK
jgi:hypothetical protein